MAGTTLVDEPLSPAETARIELGDADVGALRDERRGDVGRSSAFAAEMERQRARSAAAPTQGAPAPSQPQQGPVATTGNTPHEKVLTVEPETSVLGDAAGMAGRGALDVGHGLIESPVQIIGGISDATQNTAHIAREFNDWITDTVGPIAGGGLIFDPWPRFATGDEIKQTQTLAQALLPEIDQADSTTGAFVRGTAKFLTGFIGAGKFAGVRQLANAGRTGAAAAPFVRGALADFAAFGPHEQRLSDLIQQFPALENPVTEYLASDPTDGAAEGRFKNSLEGLALGGMTALAGEALTRGLRLIRAGRAANAAADVTLKPLLETVDAQKARFTELLGGDDAAPLFEMRPLPVPDDQLEAAARGLGRDATEDASDIFINWNRIDSSDDVKAVIQDMADANASGINAARRGVRTWEQTKFDASQEDAFKILAERRTGQPLEAAQTLAVRELWVRSGTKLRDLARQVMTDPSVLNKIAFRKMLNIHNTIQERVIAARTETARSLNAWKIQAGDNLDFMRNMDEMQALLRSDGTDTLHIAMRLNQLNESGLAREADAFVYGSKWAKGSDMVRQLFYSSLLSGPHTHIRNAIGNTAMAGMQIGERKFASLLGQAFGEQNVPTGETGAMLHGLVKGIRDAFRIAKKRGDMNYNAYIARTFGEPGEAARILAEGDTGLAHLNRLEMPRVGAFSSEKLGLDMASPLGRVMDWIDSSTRVPMQALANADDAFGAMAWNAELSAQAFRKAKGELDAGTLTREAFEDRVTALTNNPDDAMKLAAETFRRRSTFTSPPGKFGQAAIRLANRVPILGRLTLAFRGTPFAIASESFQRTPLAPLVKTWREDIAAGGARADLAISKTMIGSAIMLAMADLAMKGDITGPGSDNPEERALEARLGIKPYSVRVPTGKDESGNPSYRYFQIGKGLEPISTPIGLAATAVDILKHKDWDDDDAKVDEMLLAAAIAIGAQATSQSYMQGVSEFIEVMNDPTRYGSTYFEGLARIVIPRGAATVARIVDPNVRMVESMADSIRASTPGLSATLPLNRDVWGRPISRASGLGDLYDAISPIYSSTTEHAEPIDQELNRLELYLAKPPKRMSFDGITVDLSLRPEMYSRLTELAGNVVKQGPHGEPITARGFVSSGKGLMDELNALVTGKGAFSGMYRDMLTDGPDGGKADQIRAIQRAYVEAAKAQLVKEYPELKAELESRRSEASVRFKFQEGLR